MTQPSSGAEPLVTIRTHEGAVLVAMGDRVYKARALAMAVLVPHPEGADIPTLLPASFGDPVDLGRAVSMLLVMMGPAFTDMVHGMIGVINHQQVCHIHPGVTDTSGGREEAD